MLPLPSKHSIWSSLPYHFEDSLQKINKENKIKKKFYKKRKKKENQKEETKKKTKKKIIGIIRRCRERKIGREIKI